jgi:hypothetical protein
MSGKKKRLIDWTSYTARPGHSSLGSEPFETSASRQTPVSRISTWNTV